MLCILIVAAGYGTEALVIRRRLVALGLTPEEASDRITCVEKEPYLCIRLKNLGFHVINEDYIKWKPSDMKKFNIILGNPPYEKLWRKFILKCLSLLSDDGIMTLIVPPGWIMFRDKMSVMKSMNITHCEIDTPIFDGFNVGSEFSYFIINNKVPYQGAKVKVQNGDETIIDYKAMGYIPRIPISQHDVSISKKIKRAFEKYGHYEVQWGSGAGNHYEWPANTIGFKNTRKEQMYPGGYATSPPDGYPYRMLTTLSHFEKGEMKYASVKGLAHDYQKVIFTDAANCVAFFDDGTMGVCEHARAILCTKDQSKSILLHLNSSVKDYLASKWPANASWGGIAAAIFDLPAIIDASIASVDDIYKKIYCFSDEEIKYIDSFKKTKPPRKSKGGK